MPHVLLLRAVCDTKHNSVLLDVTEICQCAACPCRMPAAIAPTPSTGSHLTRLLLAQHLVVPAEAVRAEGQDPHRESTLLLVIAQLFSCN